MFGNSRPICIDKYHTADSGMENRLITSSQKKTQRVSFGNRRSCSNASLSFNYV